MMEESDVIDLIVAEPDGHILLVATDAGLTIDPQERYRKFKVKLRTYADYAAGPEFAATHPGKTPLDATIRLMCRLPATDQMAAITHVVPTGAIAPKIPVEIVLFPGSSTPTVPASVPTPETQCGQGSAGSSSSHLRPDPQLFFGIFENRPQVVRAAVENGANLNLPDATGVYPLQHAVESGNADLVELLFELGARIPQDCFLGRRWWVTAAGHQDANTARLLLKKGVRPARLDRLQAALLTAWRKVTRSRQSAAARRARRLLRNRRLVLPEIPSASPAAGTNRADGVFL